MNLTSEEQQAVERGQVVPVTVGRAECILIRKDVYERVRTRVDAGPARTLGKIGWRGSLIFDTMMLSYSPCRAIILEGTSWKWMISVQST